MTTIIAHTGEKQCGKCGKFKSTRRFLRGDGWCRMCRNAANRGEDTRKKRCKQCKEVKFYHEFASAMNHGKVRWVAVCRECVNTDYRRRNYHKKLDPREKRNINLLRLYGITSAEYDVIFAEQDGLCASCKRPERNIQFGKIKPLAVDHCHITGAIRGLLCDSCNQALGFMQEDPDRAEALARYIRERCLW